VDSDGVIRSAGNDVPRFDHNPLTGECLGLLPEEQRQNLLLRSEEFNDGIWGPVSGTITANAETAPNATLTADKLIAQNGGPAGQIAQGVSIASGATVTGSVYVKAGGFDRLELVLLSNNNTTPYGRSTFNPNTGAITTAAFTSNGGTNASSAVQSLSNGWYRFSVTVTYPAVTLAGMRLVVFNSDAANGDGVKGVFLWGAQLEAGAFPTSYIPTTGTAATRTADVVSITGANFSSWYRQDEGTVFADVPLMQNAARLLMFDDGTTNNRWELRPGGNAQTLNSWSANTQDVALSNAGSLGNPLSAHKVAASNATNNVAISVNGTAPSTDASSTMPANQSRFFIGSFQGTATFTNGPIRRLTYWPRRLDNSTLQSITQ
jgi:hypothetical protein